MTPEREHTGFAEATDGTALWYRVVKPTGDDLSPGDAVVLCDGILCDGFVWKYLLPAITQNRTVLHWNYRGHGRSSPPRDRSRVSIEQHAEDLWRVADAAQIRNTVLIGHSMGTQVCLEGFRASRERTTALVLICGSYGLITRTFHGTDLLSRLLPTVLDLERKHPEIFRTIISLTPRRLAVTAARLLGEVDPVRMRTEDMVPYFDHIARMDPAVFLPMVHAAGEHTAEDLLRTVTVPTLVIAAERDGFTPPRLAEQMADHIPGAHFECVKDGSHACPIEQPQLVNRRVQKFLTEELTVLPVVPEPL